MIKQKKTKNFEIREYVLPKFEVNIESPDSFTLKDGKVMALINAKYTYGKRVRGTATISISEGDNLGLFYRHGRPGKNGGNDDDGINALVKRTIQIDGRAAVEFDIKNELKYDLEEESNRFYNSKNFTIHVKLVEDLTGTIKLLEYFES